MSSKQGMNSPTDIAFARKSRVLERHSPSTGETVSRESAISVEHCQTIASRAAAAFPGWSSRPTSERAQILVAAADILQEKVDEFVASQCDEIGAPITWARHNVSFAASMLRDVASYAEEVDRVEDIPDQEGITSRAYKEPCGVCLGIAPWNAPIILGVRAIAAPLLCGNTVILKGNEFAPETFRRLGDVFHSAGIPDDVLQVVLTLPEDSETAVEALIRSPVVRRVNFTGSTRVGRRVAELCATNLKRSLLELGGQANQVVLDDADIDAAAEAALIGAFNNQGQICMSTERVIVTESVADELIEKIEAGRKKLEVGDPLKDSTDVGPVITMAAAERLSLLISDAVSKGAQLVGGGGIRGSFVEPTLIDAVEADMRLYNEEVFGPILSVTRVSDDAEAITVANDSEYGLASSVFSSDEKRALDVASQLHTGICHINRTTVRDNPHAPFGGVKASGFGRFGGRWAIQEFTELRWITSTTTEPG
ncbi:aldehyde dehydrogenase [uncultured Ruegeria sp.]|uniref:aldehyde dehydrogenase n=1 Tax=uncultured Ruegeria sp. TaxID=259304 RepID=UPI0026042463|nr:aldehyde dehydrogenase [uncultured Ruegeria sp.]